MEEYCADVEGVRRSAYDVSPLVVSRWSPRAMTGEPLSEAELMPLFEAARWAPSSRNNQPWRFRYAGRTDPEWDRFLELLKDGNRRWARNTAALVVLLSTGESATRSFSTGAAWQNMALEGVRRGLVVHPIAGFHHERARRDLDVPKVDLFLRVNAEESHHGISGRV